jgi:nitroimidazol reductase NimA-like FMN-containing flavoprotein (pyridoxamine 5'-phosphate oxidase superfamily)
MTGTLDETAAARFRELSPEECRSHLATARMGRIGWGAGGLQDILPVSYVLHAGQVVFRTSPYGALSGLRQPTPVAFEIDEVDPATGTAWSVVVRGRAEAVVLPQDLVALWARSDIVPWAPGTRNLFICITAHSVSGRALHAASGG